MSYADIIEITLLPTTTPAWNMPAADVVIRVHNAAAHRCWAATYSQAHGAEA